MNRLEVLKTYKIYIGGKFPRTESGRYYSPRDKKGKLIANVSQCSRKDLREAVVAARSALGSWSDKSAFNRSQILYRIAEMLEGRKAQFVEEMTRMGMTPKSAAQEVDRCIDRLVYYSGWCDKYHQLFGTINPVSSSHFNFSVPEPSGVTGVIADENTSLIGMVSAIAPLIAGGNTVVVLASEQFPLCAVTFAEVLNSSDVPGGVVNILTGFRKELLEHFASHMDINTVVYHGNNQKQISELKDKAALNVKRIFIYDKNWMIATEQNPYYILDGQEIKTTWHPVDNTGGGGGAY